MCLIYFRQMPMIHVGVEFFGDEIDRIVEVDVLNGEVKCSLEHTMISCIPLCSFAGEDK